MAQLEPAVSTAPSITHSTLVTSASSIVSPTFTVTLRTVAQLRQGSTPNPWEVGWVLWDWTPSDSFYALVLKPNGWELDKEVDGQEFFLATGTTPFPVGPWYHVEIAQNGPQIAVSVDGTPLVNYSDSSFSSGSIGLYCEDSQVQYGNVDLLHYGS